MYSLVNIYHLNVKTFNVVIKYPEVNDSLKQMPLLAACN